MLTAYVNAAMRRASYEILAENEGFFGRIDGLDGVWANAEDLETCRDELRSVLEEWIVLGLRMGHHIPDPPWTISPARVTGGKGKPECPPSEA